MRLPRPVLLIALLSAPSIVSFPQTPTPAKHPFTVHDWAASRSANALAVSMDGRSILYRVGYGASTGPNNREFWTIHPDGADAVKLEMPADFLPAGFVPAGDALYGTFKVNGTPQLAVFGFAGNKVDAAPRTLVALPRGVDAIAPSPDGKRVALLADPGPPDPLKSTRTVVEPAQTSLYVVNFDGTGGHWACPALQDIAAGAGSGSAPVAWSADSLRIAVISSVPKIAHHDVRSFIDLCAADVGGAPQRVADVANSISSLAFVSADDIAFASTANPVLTPDHIYTVSIAGGSPVDRTPKIDTTAEAIVADAHGNVYVSIHHGVRVEVGSWRNNAIVASYAWPDGVVGLPVFSPYAASTLQLAFSVGDPKHTTNVATLNGVELLRITRESDDQIAAIDLGPVRSVKWKSKDGVALEGIVTFPAGYVEGRKYPFLVLPHGGPESNDTLNLDPFSRGIAGLGYVVMQPEYRGSTGYGDAHLAAIYQHFGDRAYRDVDSATDFAIAQGWADPARLAIFGWSAGGFMTSWTVTQTGRYKAAIEGAGITDWGSFMFTSDVPQTDYDARWPEDDPKAFEQFSAVAYANKVTTPLLILHGEADVRVPTYQGREFYEVLAARGKTVRMVTYPGSGHFPSAWQQRINIFDEIQAWLAKYNPGT